MSKNITGENEEKRILASGLLSRLKKYLIGVAAGIIGVVVMLCISSLILTISGVPDALLDLFAYLSVAVGAFVAGYISLRLLGSSGLTNGLATGALMFFIQFIVSLAFSDGKVFSLQTLVYLLINCLLATVGGIVGVNNKKRRFFK